MTGIIFLVIFLIAIGILIYYVHKKGLIPFTNPYSEKKKEVINKLILEILKHKQESNPRRTINYINNKIRDIENNLAFGTKNLKDFVKDTYSDILSFKITKIINHYASEDDKDTILDRICATEFNIADLITKTKYKNYHTNTGGIKSITMSDSELFNACYHLVNEPITEKLQVDCYNKFSDINGTNGNICSIERMNKFLDDSIYEKMLEDLDISLD
jgi:hypothetical protein